MSIVGIGIDIIEIVRIKKIFFNFKHKFAKRILSVYEWDQYILKNEDYISFLAKRFAVKEAAAKALGTGINSGIQFNQFDLYHDHLGKPKLRFFKSALIKSNLIKCKFIHVSISDQKLYAYALVILES